MRTSRLCLALSAMLIFGLSTSAPGAAATGAAARPSGSIRLDAAFGGDWHGIPCPTGAPKTHQCGEVNAEATVPGLGPTTEQWTFDLLNEPLCSHVTFGGAHLVVGTLGQIDLSLMDSSPTTPAGCDTTDTGPTVVNYTVTGGSGRFAGATGSGTMRPILVGDAGGSVRDTYSGTLAVPDVTFDLTAPTISGFRPKVVRIPKSARSVRVNYHVKATDNVDGDVPVTCKPRSGSRFRVGTTPIACSAGDSSGNTATATFKLRVIRKR
jgi:hypothetical protein